MAISYGQDVIPPIKRREIILAENEQFSQANYHLRLIEFQILGIEQSEENRVHFRVFEDQLQTAVRNLKAVLQVARTSLASKTLKTTLKTLVGPSSGAPVHL